MNSRQELVAIREVEPRHTKSDMRRRNVAEYPADFARDVRSADTLVLKDRSPQSVFGYRCIGLGESSLQRRPTNKVLCVVSPPRRTGRRHSHWLGGEHHAKNPLD